MPPNILFILTDQQRADTCGCYGQKLTITPTLDTVASDGVLFENVFSVQPVCGPTRACIQTGLYATQHGSFRNDIALKTDAHTIPKYLSEAGYNVGYIGKWHLASNHLPPGHSLSEHRSFSNKPIPPEYRGGYKDYWLAADALEHTSHGYTGGYMFNADMQQVDFPGYRVDSITNFVLDYLEQQSDQQPFFLFVSYLEPHHQNDHHHYEGPPGSKEKFKDFIVPEDLKGTKGDWRSEFPDYLGCCWSIDQNLDRILRKLEEKNLRENTLLIYTSDHGSHFRTRNFEYKRSCHESSIHVPLILQGPGFRGGKRISELVTHLDLLPTILEYTNISIPSSLPGQPLQTLLDGNLSDWRKEVFIQISESEVGRALRTNKWKYSIAAPHANRLQNYESKLYREEYLYDLETDPYERKNLVSDPKYKQIREQLSTKIKEKMQSIGESIPEILPKKNQFLLF